MWHIEDSPKNRIWGTRGTAAILIAPCTLFMWTCWTMISINLTLTPRTFTFFLPFPQSATICRIHLSLGHSIQWVMRPIFWRRAIDCTRSMVSRPLDWATRRFSTCCAPVESMRVQPLWRSSTRCPNAVSRRIDRPAVIYWSSVPYCCSSFPK